MFVVPFNCANECFERRGAEKKLCALYGENNKESLCTSTNFLATLSARAMWLPWWSSASHRGRDSVRGIQPMSLALYPGAGATLQRGIIGTRAGGQIAGRTVGFPALSPQRRGERKAAVALPAAAAPTTYHVTPRADYAGATPCYATLQAVIDAAVPGDEIRVA